MTLSSDITYSWPPATPKHSVKLFYSLRDAAENPILLALPAGGTATEIEIDDTVDPGVLGSPTSRTYNPVLRPAVSTLPSELYHLHVRTEVQPTTGGGFNPSGSKSGPGFIAITIPNKPSGDAAYNVITAINSTFLNNFKYFVPSVGSEFSITTQLKVIRYDDYLDAPDSKTVNFLPEIHLRDQTTGLLVPMVKVSGTASRSLPSHSGGAIPAPYVEFVNVNVLFKPGAAGHDNTHTYKPEVVPIHTDNGDVVTGNSHQAATSPFFYLNGKMYFGPLESDYFSIFSDPHPGVVGVDGKQRVNLNTVAYPLDFPTGWAFGPFACRVETDGSAHYEGAVAVPVINGGGAVDFTGPGNLRMRRTGLNLTDTGAVTNSLLVKFPAGFGYSHGADDLDLRTEATFNNAALGAGLLPTGNFTLTAASLGLANIYIYHERMPLMHERTSLTLKSDSGQFEWSNGPVLHPDAAVLAVLDSIRPSLHPSVQGDTRGGNDQLFRPVTTAAGNQTFQVDGAGNSLAGGFVVVPAATLTPHFPAATEIAHDGGTIKMTNGFFDTAFSSLTGLSGHVSQSEHCPHPCSVGAFSAVHAFTSSGNAWITPDGGLGVATLHTVPAKLRWGRIDISPPTHEAGEWSGGRFLMPGFVQSGSLSVAGVNPAAQLLLTGRGAPDNASLAEAPGTTGYTDGLADYAGLNFRSTAGLTGRSTLGGTSTGNYSLRSTVKYCARLRGVQAIHEATPGSFPASLTIYGFNVNFSRFAVTFQNNFPVDSLIEGTVEVPAPSAFSQAFNRLQIDCVGQLGAADPPNAGWTEKSLQYWQTDFTPHSMAFAQPRRPGMPCPQPSDSTGYFTMGARLGNVHLLGNNRSARLSFRNNGNLIRPVDTEAGQVAEGNGDHVSLVALPPNVELRGLGADPASQAYKLTPIRRAYFNDFTQAGRPDNGFLNVVAKVDLPFFEDMKVHLHVETMNPLNTKIMGGWPRDGVRTSSAGWEVMGRHFFNQTDFDRQHRGWADGTTIDNYRTPAIAAATYRPRAQRFWLDLVDFDYPVKWDQSTNTMGAPDLFNPDNTAVAWTNPTQQVAIFELRSKLPQLTPTQAEIQFKFQANQALPRLNAQTLLGDLARRGMAGVGGNAGPLQSIISALGNNNIERALNGQLLMDELTNTVMRELVDRALVASVDPLVDQIYTAAQNAYGNGVLINNALCGPMPYSLNPPQGVLHLIDGEINMAVDRVLGGIDQVTGVAERIDTTMIQLRDGVDALRGIVAVNGSGQAPAIATIINQLLQDANLPEPLRGAIVGLINSAAETGLQRLITAAGPALRDLDRFLVTVRGIIEDLRVRVSNITSPIVNLLRSIRGRVVEYSAFKTQLKNDLCNFLRDLLGDAARFLNENTPAEVKSRIRSFIRDQITGSFIYTELQNLLRNVLAPVRQLYEATIGAVFARIESIMTQIMGEATRLVGAITEPINKALGPVDDALRGTKFHGYARINGDTLQEARVDVEMEWKLGRNSPRERPPTPPNNPPNDDALRLHGYFAVKNLRSSSPGAPSMCSSEGTEATEVILGVERVPIRFANTNVHLSAEGKVVFAGPPGSIPAPRSIGGRIQMDGTLRFGEVSVTDPRLAFMFGATTGAPVVPLCHLAGRARGRYRSWEVDVGAFLGTTCDFEPLRLVDDQIQDRVINPIRASLEDPTFGTANYMLGLYLRGRVWIPVNEVLGIPSSCLLDLRANAGVGGFVFLAESNKPSDPAPGIDTLIAGGNFIFGVEGRVLCIGSVEGEIGGAAVGSIYLPDLRINPVAGVMEGRVAGCIGFDPFKLCVEKRLSYQLVVPVPISANTGTSNPPAPRPQP
jgi:hypothetical protein